MPPWVPSTTPTSTQLGPKHAQEFLGLLHSTGLQPKSAGPKAN